MNLDPFSARTIDSIFKGLFTPSDPIMVTVTNVMLIGKMGMQPILPITVPVKKIKGAARQCNNDGD